MGMTDTTKHHEGGPEGSRPGSDRALGGVFTIRQSGDTVDIPFVKFAPVEKETR